VERAAVKGFPEITQPSTLVDAMVAMDEHLSNLKLAQKAGWKTLLGHAGISPAHEAMMLWEQFKEMARTADTAKQTEDYREKLTESEQATDGLRKLLQESSDPAVIDAAFKKVGQSCAACHKKYRNE
jgi:predicted urease superfamily metal-dependent hydrolase